MGYRCRPEAERACAPTEQRSAPAEPGSRPVAASTAIGQTGQPPTGRNGRHRRANRAATRRPAPDCKIMRILQRLLKALGNLRYTVALITTKENETTRGKQRWIGKAFITFFSSRSPAWES